MSSDPLPAWNEDPARYLRGGEGSNQPDRSSCFRSSPSSLPALPLAFLFFPENATGATTIDTWRGAEGRGDEGRGGGREGRVAPHISLISVSVVVVVSVGAQPTTSWRGTDHPSIHHLVSSSFRSRPTLPSPFFLHLHSDSSPLSFLLPSRKEFRSREIATEQEGGKKGASYSFVAFAFRRVGATSYDGGGRRGERERE